MLSRDMNHNGAVIRFDARILPAMEPGLFDVAWLRSHQLWQGSTAGRSQAHFFHHAGHDMVLRHFHRGGLLGRVNRDLYLRTGAARSRALREFDLLKDMLAGGLPVPRPVAARYVPFGPFYRADIITQRIPNARPLQEVLEEKALSAPLWHKIGAHVRSIHDHGVFHSDLNCRNILLDTDDDVWIIDFDKCDRRPPGPWQQQNLDRFRRSLRKTKANMPGMHWHENDWADLIVGYERG